MAEIKEIKEKQQKEGDILQAIAAGNKQPLVPHLEFEYSDVGIHEDLYKLICYSSEEVFSSKEMLNKIMRLWSTFLEPMLGVPSRSHGKANIEEQKPEYHVQKFVASNAGNGDGNLNGISRQPKSDKNEVDGRASEVQNLQQTSLPANDKNNGSVNVDHSFRDNMQMAKCETSADYINNVSGFNRQFGSDEQGANGDASVSVRENSQPKSSLEMMSGVYNINAALMSHNISAI